MAGNSLVVGEGRKAFRSCDSALCLCVCRVGPSPSPSHQMFSQVSQVLRASEGVVFHSLRMETEKGRKFKSDLPQNGYFWWSKLWVVHAFFSFIHIFDFLK